MRCERDKLERRRDKLTQAHYEGAIPVDLLKREHERISTGLLIFKASWTRLTSASTILSATYAPRST